MSDFLPYGRQWIDDEDIAAVARVLRSDFLTSGPEVDAFEKEFAAMTGSAHAIAFANATAALHAAVHVAGIGPGDRVITSPNTFLSSANCAAFVGATPDFADIDPVTHNLDPAALEAMWTDDVKAVVPVAFGGQPADMPRIAKIARAHGAVVIEDASHATGGGFFREGKAWKTGNHPWAEMTVFSFHPVKTMTTGEGGMLVTSDGEFARKARLFRSHGVERDAARFEGFGVDGGPLAEVGPWVYEMHDLGHNHRITDIQCALGRTQLAKLPCFIERRREIVATYNNAFADLPWLETPGLGVIEDRDHISWHLYTVEIDFPALGRSRSDVMAALRCRGVGSQVLYIPVHLQPWYRRTYGYCPGKCPVAEKYYTRCLSLPLHPSLTAGDVARVIAAVRELGGA
ncbi:MAG: UDP-4-amino-4,6-dideoxy-N-acetyl-beta-L-altrosamine transaminase [Verrucomicrobia bacterium]|nr:UDP-4-amino-4,6-dideoxy-N-acetyl-beta-L-altrosamine transaminase [Verrucomicrobiota bacterium]